MSQQPSRFVAVLAICLAVLFTISCQAEEISCNSPVHYKELGCKPIIKDGEKCPASFDCDHLKTQDTTKCYDNGKPFVHMQQVADEDLPPCVPYAYCEEGYFNVGHYDCSPTLLLDAQECVYLRDKCCSRYVCGEEKIAELTVCYLDGEKFYGGERRNPMEDKCVECTCAANFDNSTSIYENSNCRAVNCRSDFWNIIDYRKGCAPMFYGKDRCCPSNMKCPSANDKVIKATEPHADSDLKCKFGDLELQVGDKVNEDRDNCMSCECRTPPLVECHRIEGCERVFN